MLQCCNISVVSRQAGWGCSQTASHV